jgi:MerR family transcriptional regulator, thiopeptide resistance regulator
MHKIGIIAQQAGVTTRTLRYYEQLGLIIPSSVSSNGYRYYSDETLAILTRIRSLQHAGLSLTEIKEIIGLYFKEKKTVEAKTKSLLYFQSHLDEINKKIKTLSKVKKELREQIKSTQHKLEQFKEKGRKNGGSKN